MSAPRSNAARPVVGRVYKTTKSKNNSDATIFYRIDGQPSVDEYKITSFNPAAEHNKTFHRPRVLWSSLRTRGLVEVTGDEIPDELWSGPPRVKAPALAHASAQGFNHETWRIDLSNPRRQAELFYQQTLAPFISGPGQVAVHSAAKVLHDTMTFAAALSAALEKA